MTPVLWLCGASGVGKSTVGWEVFTQVQADGVTAAYFDFDQIGFCRPEPEDDPSNHRLKAANLAAIWPNFVAAGARCLVVSGIVNHRSDVQFVVGAAPGTTWTVCRLRVEHGQLRERIFRRGEGGGPPVPGDELRYRSPAWLAAAAEDSVREADDMEQLGLGDLCVDTTDRSIEDVARLVRAQAGGWPQL